ncbi:MAG: hypothetical protein OQK75_01225 [Gammaproteobacteria bacterium]|nr:hypothetical protein [Gammaproteobacteria bacterium]MCW8986267.1 hypothetical protein [Gammaproteobacteria bacterium]MCW9031683.1 hypothetical protein [Gammaproteobacteria bacterium]
MKIKQNYVVIIATALLLILAGCRANPILNIEDAPIEITGKHSSNDIKKAIIRAGAGLGWTMKAKESGHIVGTLFLRKHVAIVDVKYTNKAYSITYKDSQNLDFDGSNIHKNYNSWVQNLNRQIQAQLSAL